MTIDFYIKAILYNDTTSIHKKTVNDCRYMSKNMHIYDAESNTTQKRLHMRA